MVAGHVEKAQVCDRHGLSWDRSVRFETEVAITTQTFF